MPKRPSQISVPTDYEGREQSFIKHRLLESYLEKLFLILGMSSARLCITELCYVDCFAGPWGNKSDDLSGTSIAVSLGILEKCRGELEKQNITLKIRALYVENDPAAYAQLESYIAGQTPEGIEAESLNGDFVDFRERILQWCGDQSFTFFFIDPTGWKSVSVSTLLPLLQRTRSEFLINFMYDFVNRTVSMAAWKEEMKTFLGEAVDMGQRNAQEREKFLVDTYRRNLKLQIACGNWSARSAHVRVLDREKERPKYHLVYLTSHPRGIIEFMEISERLDFVQTQIRALRKWEKQTRESGSEDLFGFEPATESPINDDIMAEVKAYWLDYLADGKRRVGIEEFAQLLEDTGWFPGDFQRALRQLIDDGKVRNLDEKRKRPKRPLHYEESETLTIVEAEL